MFSGIRIPQRWVFAVMGFLALFIAYAMRVCLSIAITEMVVPEKYNNDTIFDEDVCEAYPDDNPKNSTSTSGGTYEWSQSTQVR